MGRSDLERLSREELIELVLRLQRPDKTSRTFSKPPGTDRKERREQSKPGGAKPGHEGHSRAISDDPDAVVEHRPDRCSCCGGALHGDLPAEIVSVSERIELPEVAPVVTQHRRLAVHCPTCEARVVAPVPEAARGTPFGPRLHTVATYLKTFQALSYERLQAALSDLFGLTLSQGGLMNLLQRAQRRFRSGCAAAVSALRRAAVVASDETGVRIEGSNAYHWVFHSAEAVVHQASPTRGAVVVREMMDGHRPAVWISDRYTARARPRGCAPNLLRPSRPGRRLCRRSERRPRALAAAALAAGRVRPGRARHRLGHLDAGRQASEPGSTAQRHPRHTERLRPDPSPPGQDRSGSPSAPGVPCPSRRGRADQQRLGTAAAPVRDPAEGDQRLPRDVGREGEADIRTVVDTARLTGATPFGTILKTVGA